MQSFSQLKAGGGGAAYLKQFYAESLGTVTVTHTRIHVLCKARFWCLVCLNHKIDLHLSSPAG